ncbi:helix-turn-helix domain-containing protein [Allokutzneria sp. NRRL B-24872]|uniref:helix-turn-helix domain-containing protein n=1 Tax=Allokutzneria sp. NRRL B-24872 TaxID=1137961 RepID=UPI000A3CF5E7|nr:transcriptional regulator [Allokutzneria sp. NRRL B-24872]
MSQDWTAVAKAINERLTELGLRQRELAERSGVSQAMIREIQYNTAQRRRGSRTLEALSLALDWHPQHLASLLRGHQPPSADETSDPVADRLAAIQDSIDELAERLDQMNANLAMVIDHARPDRKRQ